MSTNIHWPRPRRSRRTLTVSAAAMMVAATALVGHDAIAGNVTVNTSFGDVYGNSLAGDPSTVDTAASPSNNTLSLAPSANLTNNAYGAWAEAIAVGGNTVAISGGAVGHDVYGGYASILGDVTSNTVVISGGIVVGETMGAYTQQGAAHSNTVTITGGTIGGDVSGGTTYQGNAVGNAVSISGGTLGTVPSTIYLYGGYADGGDAIGNTVTIGGTASIDADQIRGGHSMDGYANGNSVVINGGTVAATIAGGVSEEGIANDNSVIIRGGTVDADVIAGGGALLAATGNSVEISGGAITVSAIGGGWVTNGSATENTVTILGTPSISDDVALFGGYCERHCTDVFTGNTLNLKTTGLTVGSLSNFQLLNFYLPTGLTAGSTVLTVTGTADLTSGSASSTVDVGINGASSALAVGDSVTLIHAGTLLTNANLNTTATGAGLQGVTLAYVFGISADSNDLTATVESVGVNAGSKALSEGYVAAAALLNQGADLASGTGMANAIAAADGDRGMFGAMAGSAIRTQTGSHVDVDGITLMAGLARGFDVAAGRLTTAAFAEYGSGSYDTFNGLSTGDIRGGGDSHSVGGGLLGRMDFAAIGPGHVYAEASARIGRAGNSFNSADLTSGGIAAGYDASSTYFGASAGVGYVWALNRATTLDVSGRYLWSHLDGDSVRLTTGETVDFADINSQRARLGGRLSSALVAGIAPHVGAAWEREFDGKARAMTNGLALATPSMRGNTGILEAGLTLTPSATLPLTVDMDVKGFLGQREGIAGSLQAKLAF